MKNWKTIKPENVRMVWGCTDDDCDCSKEECITDGEWHEVNGTPVCDCGQDMSFLRTEVADRSDGSIEGDLAVVQCEDA